MINLIYYMLKLKIYIYYVNMKRNISIKEIYRIDGLSIIKIFDKIKNKDKNNKKWIIRLGLLTISFNYFSFSFNSALAMALI